MRFLKLALLPLLLFITNRTIAQGCTCIVIDNAVVQNEQGTVTITIKNNCNRRMWFYTKGFWMTLSEPSEHNVKPRKLFRLTNDEPEYRLFKWKDEKQMVFHSDKLKEVYDHVSVSYSNTTNQKPTSLIGYRTYLCETDVKTEHVK